jgi:hypothetical protein
MKRKGIICALAITAILVLVSAVFVPAVSAETRSAGYIEANDDQIKLINDLWGTDITVGDYYEKVYPQLLEGLEVDTKNKLYNLKITWPEPPSKGEAQYSNKIDSDLAAKFEELEERSGTKSIVLTYGDSTISAAGRSVTFKSESWVVFPPYLKIPYMGVTSYLLYWDGSQGHVVYSNANAGYWIYNIKAQMTRTVSQSGNYYTAGIHINQFPAGYEPPEECWGTTSGLYYVT